MSTAQVVRLVFSSAIISGAIQPSVPATPDRLEKDILPIFNFLHKPKSEIIALISPFALGVEISTLGGCKKEDY